MMGHRWGLNRNVLWHMESSRVWNNTTEISEQQKTTSWTPNDQATDEPVPMWYFCCGSLLLHIITRSPVPTNLNKSTPYGTVPAFKLRRRNSNVLFAVRYNDLPKSITKTLYRTALGQSKVLHRWRFPNPTELSEDWLMYENVCSLDMLDYLTYIHIYFYMKILIFSY